MVGGGGPASTRGGLPASREGGEPASGVSPPHSAAGISRRPMGHSKGHRLSQCVSGRSASLQQTIPAGARQRGPS